MPNGTPLLMEFRRPYCSPPSMLVVRSFVFAAFLLAHGVRSVGVAHAAAAISLLFGLLTSAGISGMAMTDFFACVVARSMLDTSGWALACLIHFVQDVIIFLMLLMAGV